MTITNNLVGIISDTHDQVHHLVKVIDYFNNQNVELVVHCGDWVSPFTLIHYQKLKAPLYGIFGNNDGDHFRHIIYSKSWGINLHLESHFLSFVHANKKIAVYHGEYDQIVKALAKSGDHDIVLFGHDHKARIEHYGDTIALNPGTLMDYTNESVQGASFALFNFTENTGKIIRVNHNEILEDK